MTNTVPKILIVGGGYAGFYTAWKLEKHLRKGEADVTIVDPLPYMTYQPFLPEVAAGSIEARHSVVALRRHLKRTTVVAAKVTGINHADKVATITPIAGEPYELEYDQIVVTAGAVSRTFPIPGIADNAIGLKTIEEAVAIRDRLMSNFDKASMLPAGPERDRLLTVVVVGGGFAGIEVFAELRSLASSLVKSYPQITFDDTHFHLIEAMGRIMPEVSLKTSEWVLKNLAKRGASVHLDTQVTGAVGGNIELSTRRDHPERPHHLDRRRHGEPHRGARRRPARRGARSHPHPRRPARRHRGRDRRGRLGGRRRLRRARPLGRRRRRLLRAQRPARGAPGEAPREEPHRRCCAASCRASTSTRTSAPSRASVSTTACSSRGNLALKGLVAWLAHRGYHGLAMPSWERKWRVLWGWWNNFWLGRDIVNLSTVQSPRYVFEEFAARPRPPQPVEARRSRRPRPPRPRRLPHARPRRRPLRPTPERSPPTDVARSRALRERDRPPQARLRR